MSLLNKAYESIKDKNSYTGPILQVELRSTNGDLHKDILGTMHNTFKGMQDYADFNIVVNGMVDTDGCIAGVYVCLDDVKDMETLTSKMSELGVNITETYNKYMDCSNKQPRIIGRSVRKR